MAVISAALVVLRSNAKPKFRARKRNCFVFMKSTGDPSFAKAMRIILVYFLIISLIDISGIDDVIVKSLFFIKKWGFDVYAPDASQTYTPPACMRGHSDNGLASRSCAAQSTMI